MKPWSAPRGTNLGWFMVPSPAGWVRWLPATGSLRLLGTFSLDASPALLGSTYAWAATGRGTTASTALGVARLPKLHGLNVSGLRVDDETLAVLLNRQHHLIWLDVRDTDVTAAGLEALLDGHRRLQRLAVSLPVAQLFDRLQTGGLELHVDTPAVVMIEQPAIAPDRDRLLVLLREHSVGVADPGAVHRAEVLLDVDRPADAFALVGPLLGTGDPVAAIQAARCLHEMGEPAAGLAALTRATPGPDVEMWCSVLLVENDPVTSVQAATSVLSHDPDNVRALWARCNAYISAGQDLAAHSDLVALTAQQPDAVSTWLTAARLARARNKPHAAIDAYQRVLAQQPDHTDALAGLSQVQRQARPLSSSWIRNLANAAAGDLARQGATLLDEVTSHRRAWVRTSSFAVLFATMLLASELLVGVRVGVVLVPALAVGFVVTGVMWALTPADVRTRIRRTDQVAGTRRAPDWRRGALPAAVALGALVLLPGHVQKPAPKPSCFGSSHRDCIPQHVPSIPPMPSMPPMPTLPPFPEPSDYLPSGIPTFPDMEPSLLPSDMFSHFPPKNS